MRRRYFAILGVVAVAGAVAMTDKRIAMNMPPEQRWGPLEKAKPTVRLGNTVVLKRPIQPGDPRFYTREKFQRTRVLTVDLMDLKEYQQGPGSWVMAIQGKTRVGSARSPLVRGVPNLVAYVEFGSGGVTQITECDAWRNVIALPSETLQVSVGFEGVGPLSPDLPPTYAYPTEFVPEVEITATIHRTNDSASPLPHRSFWILDADAQIPIPVYAAEWQLFTGVGDSPLGAPADTPLVTIHAGGSWNNEVSPIGGTQLAQYTAAQIGSMLRSNCSRPLPPNADVFSWSSAGFAGQILTVPIVSFGLDL